MCFTPPLVKLEIGNDALLLPVTETRGFGAFLTVDFGRQLGLNRSFAAYLRFGGSAGASLANSRLDLGFAV